MTYVACSSVSSPRASGVFPLCDTSINLKGEGAFDFCNMSDTLFGMDGTSEAFDTPVGHGTASSRKCGSFAFTFFVEGAFVKILMMLRALSGVLVLGRSLKPVYSM